MASVALPTAAAAVSCRASTIAALPAFADSSGSGSVGIKQDEIYTVCTPSNTSSVTSNGGVFDETVRLIVTGPGVMGSGVPVGYSSYQKTCFTPGADSALQDEVFIDSGNYFGNEAGGSFETIDITSLFGNRDPGFYSVRMTYCNSGNPASHPDISITVS